MTHIATSIILRTASLALLALSLSLAQAAEVQHQATTLDFGDFQSQGEWTYPEGKSGLLPAVILIHGSTPADLDFTVRGADGAVKSHIFADLAQALSARGIAVLRYNKHYVSGSGQVDYASYYGKADLNTFLKDAGTVLSAAEHNPRVDPHRIFVYGWSEGSTVASALVAQHPEVRGLIVQGPVALSWRQTFEAQFNEVQLPYLRQVVPGGLTTANLAKVFSGPGGLVAHSVVSYLSDPQAAQLNPPQYRINPYLDSNKDGTLQLDSEVVPGMETVLDFALTPQGFLNIYAPGKALPTVTEQVSHLKVPMLVLQGQNDANTPLSGLNLLRAAFKTAGTRAIIKVYSGLGHSLGLAKTLIDDDFRPIAARPMQDAADWILLQGSGNLIANRPHLTSSGLKFRPPYPWSVARLCGPSSDAFFDCAR